MVPNTAPVVPALLDSAVFGSVAQSGNSEVVPVASESLFPQGSAAGASPRPEVRDSSVGLAPQAGDRGFAEASETPPSLYAPIVDQDVFRG